MPRRIVFSALIFSGILLSAHAAPMTDRGADTRPSILGCPPKGWGPGNYRDGGYVRNPAGPQFKTVAQFLKTVPEGKPFCFWFGSQDPRRPYEAGSGARGGLTTDRWLAGDPEPFRDRNRPYGDCDDGPTKSYIMAGL